MYSVWWKSFFISLYMVILVANIAFTFNIVNVVNPSSLSLDYPNYYFGVSSFIDNFKTWFGNNSSLVNFWGAIQKLSSFVSRTFYTYQNPSFAISGIEGYTGNSKSVLLALLSLVLFIQNAIPMFLMIIIGLLYILYLLFFVSQIILFFVAFLGGSFATPLPNVYPELNEPLNALAMMV